MKVITRDLINKNILHIDYTDPDNVATANYEEMSRLIDRCKNLIQYHGGTVGNSVIIGMPPSLTQTACVLACLELGISIVVIDYSRPDNFTQYEYIDPKTEMLLPIDFFIVDDYNQTDKHDYFSRTCKTTIIIRDFDLTDEKFDKENKEVLATNDSIAIKCTSSGTTGTPKKIFHTHEFIHQISIRNSKMFDGVVGLGFNLNHGSSSPSYYLPALHSDKVTQLVHFGEGDDKYRTIIKDKQVHINHLMLPYRHMIEEVANYELNERSDITLYTLSVVPGHLRDRYKAGKFKDIISMFGCNETSGPVFINRISNEPFQENAYYEIDDFYDVNIVEGTLHVGLPVYSNIIDTKDLFDDAGDKFIFKGRADVQRINGVDINLNGFYINARFPGNCDVIFDVERSAIYLAAWDEFVPVAEAVKFFNEHLAQTSKNLYINKVQVLKKDEFLSGVKIDHELLREYFRNYVPELTQAEKRG